MAPWIQHYFSCALNTWRVTAGWFHLVNRLSLTSSVLLTGLVAFGENDPSLRRQIGIAALVCDGIALLSEELYDFSQKAIDRHYNNLRTAIEEEDGYIFRN